MSDMSATIIPKSDQLNSDDLISGPMTITITGVTIRPGTEQPISIHYDGDNGKPYKACKSMCRVMVTAWGPDSKRYVGRSMTLYRDPSVKWGGMEVGGIRISHMSDIDTALTMALTVTRANRKPYTVKPLKSGAQPKAAAGQVMDTPESSTDQLSVRPNPASAAAPTDAEIVASIEQAVKRKSWDEAYDMARSIKDQKVRDDTAGRIAKAHKYVTDKEATV